MRTDSSHANVLVWSLSGLVIALIANDEDEYEGRYGIEDTRQAIAEARSQGVSVFCLTIDREGSAYLRHMFGPHGYAVVADVTELPERLPEVYRMLTRAAR
jgi:nitric oxide reductase NorD protein